jgi:hypothetical protein
MESRVREHGPDARGMVGMVAVEIVFLLSPQSRDNILSPYIAAPNDRHAA